MRYVCVFVLMMLLASACRDKIICAAFQSTYILDDSTRTAYFSYVWQLDDATRDQYIASLDSSSSSTPDSGAVVAGDQGLGWGEYYAYAGDYQPTRHNVRKTKYGIVKYEPYWLKNYNMKTSPMENVLGPEKPLTTPEEPQPEQLIAGAETELDSAAVAPVAMDSTGFASDSVAVASAEDVEEEPKKKEQRYRFRYDPKDNFNVEQDYYNKYFGVLLLDLTPEPEEQPSDSLANISNGEVVPDSLATKEKKGLKGLFKKKNKLDPEPVEEVDEANDDEEEDS